MLTEIIGALYILGLGLAIYKIMDRFRKDEREYGNVDLQRGVKYRRHHDKRDNAAT